MSVKRLCWRCLVVALFFLVACSQADLRVWDDTVVDIPDDRISVKGSFCAPPPSDLSYPVKVMFIVDNSASMVDNDPDYRPGSDVPEPPMLVDTPPCPDCMNQRRMAVEAVWRRYEDNPNVHFSLIVYPRTGFGSPRSRNDVNESTANKFVQGPGDDYFPHITSPGGVTPMRNALDKAYEQIRNDIYSYEKRERRYLNYVIIFLTDGMPEYYTSTVTYNNGVRTEIWDVSPILDDNAYSTPQAEVKAARDKILGLAKTHPVKIAFNSAYLGWDRSQSDVPVVKEAMELMDDLTRDDGNGKYAEFWSKEAPGRADEEPVSFLDFMMTAFIQSFVKKTLLVSNENVWANSDGTIALDSDGDGLLDTKEIELGLDPTRRDSDGDYCSDFVELLISKPGDGSDCGCEEADRIDSDGDGLLDCEEKKLRTDQWVFDTDLDGIDDRTELIMGTRFGEKDMLEDSDLDGESNLDEILGHTNPTTTDPMARPSIQYHREVLEAGLTLDGRMCYDFDVSNITLGQTLAGPDGREGVNRICLTLIEASRDAHEEDPGIMRVGCYEVQYLGEGVKVPPGNVIHADPDDKVVFKLFGGLAPAP